MANHITNILVVKSHIKEFSEKFINDGFFDFNNVIPMPKDLDVPHESGQEMKLIEFLGYLNQKNDMPFVFPRANDEYLQSFNLDKFKTYLSNLQNFGVISWYDWRVKNWGTKWNAYDCSIKRSNRELIVRFDTAWRHPNEIISKIMECIPNIEIYIEWADEDLGANCGHYSIKNNEKINLEQADYKNNSKDERSSWWEFAGKVKYPGCWDQIRLDYLEADE